jgi:hypothetical protein
MNFENQLDGKTNKLKRIINYFLFFIVSNALYGTLLYIAVTNLAKISPLYGYLGNFVLILLGLALDEFVLRKFLHNKSLMAMLKNTKTDKDKDLMVHQVRWMWNHYLSFKTSLFLFYIAVLFISQIIRFKPNLAGEDFTNFIGAIDYSILILLAFKDLGEEFTKDRNKAKKASLEFEEQLAEYQTERKES